MYHAAGSRLSVFPLIGTTDSARVSDNSAFFSPHYRQLADLRKLCPGVPILALSATCRHDVLRDIVAILSLPPLTHGTGTHSPLFSLPYYRSTLTESPSCRSARHSALPKPALPQEPALQGTPEVLGPYSRCAGNGQVHTRAPPQRDWDRVLSLARSKNYPFRVPVADITFLV